MSYNFSHRNLPKQTQEILRQQELSEERRKQEEKKRLDTISNQIIEFLKNEKEPRLQSVIASSIRVNKADVLKALNVLTKENKVKMVILFDQENNIDSPHYTI